MEHKTNVFPIFRSASVMSFEKMAEDHGDLERRYPIESLGSERP